MSHTVQKLTSNKVKISFQIPAEAFDEAMQKSYLKNRGRINVPGFRQGKAPRKLIENMYGEGVFYDDAFDLLFPDAYQAAVKENDLLPVDQPSVDIGQIGTGKELQFTCEVFVQPEVTLGDYKNLTVSTHEHPVTDEMVKAQIEQDRERTSRLIDVTDRPVEQGDTVTLDYAGSVDGVAFAGGTAQNQTLVIGSGNFIPGFEEQMVGMAIGEEKDLSVTFPTEYHSEELAGKAAVFHVKVNGIQKKELPELDDDFAMDVSEFDTFAAYEADKRKKLEEEAQESLDSEMENALVEKAVENATLDVPPPMIEEQLDQIMREMQLRMAYQGLKMEDYLKYTGQTAQQLRDMYKNEAESRVKSELVLDAIRKAEAIEPTQEDIDAQVALQAKRSGQDEKAFAEKLTDRQKEYIKDTAGIMKVIALLKSTATFVKEEGHHHHHDGHDHDHEDHEEQEDSKARKTAKTTKAKKDKAEDSQG
jgi:trigger factor